MCKGLLIEVIHCTGTDSNGKVHVLYVRDLEKVHYFRFNFSTGLHWTPGFVHCNLVKSIGHVCVVFFFFFFF